jgi:hypothetical protein
MSAAAKLILFEPPPLFVACVPVAGDSDVLVYAPATLAVTRSSCWSRTLEWADKVYASADQFRRIQKKHQLVMTPAIKRHEDTWARYNPNWHRGAKVRWLQRHGCRVVAGDFVVKEKVNHEKVSKQKRGGPRAGFHSDA